MARRLGRRLPGRKVSLLVAIALPQEGARVKPPDEDLEPDVDLQFFASDQIDARAFGEVNPIEVANALSGWLRELHEGEIA